MKVFRRFIKGILLKGESSDPTDNLEGSLWHNSTSNRIKSYVQAAVRTLVSEDQTQIMTNKTIGDDIEIQGTTTSTDKDTGALVVQGGVGIEENLNVGGNAVVTGDLTVNGTTTTINTTNVDVTDKNITINDTGNDASAEGAGITIERVGTDGSIVYEDALAAKFKAGAFGSEIELANVSSTQTLTNKTIVVSNNTITTAASGNLTSIELNAALAELQTDIDGRATRLLDNLTNPTDINLTTLTFNAAGGLATPDNGAGNSEDITLQTGTATGTRGSIILNGLEIDASSSKITNVVDPTAAQDAATKNYVDSVGGGDVAAIHDNVAGEISVITEKVTPVAGDFLLIEDSAAANAKKRIQIGNLPGGGGTNNSSLTLENVGFAVSVGASAATIALKQSDGSTDPAAGAGAITLGFDQTDGTYDVLSVTAALSVVITSGATLGHLNAVEGNVYIYAIDNAGTVELAISSAMLNETILHTTTAFTAGSDSSSLYSTTLRSNVPIKLIGRWLSTQTTAGTWAAITGDKSTNPENLKSNNNDYLEAIASSGSGTVSADTYVDAPGLSLVIPPGVWDLYYNVAGQAQWFSNTNSFEGNMAITDSSNVVLVGTVSFRFIESLDGTNDEVIQYIGSTRITVTETETYKIRLRCGVAAAVHRMFSRGGDFTVNLTNPDMHSVFQARRVS